MRGIDGERKGVTEKCNGKRNAVGRHSLIAYGVYKN